MCSGGKKATVDWTDQRWPAMNPWTEEMSAERIKIGCNLIEFGNQCLLEAKTTVVYLLRGGVK